MCLSIELEWGRRSKLMYDGKYFFTANSYKESNFRIPRQDYTFHS